MRGDWWDSDNNTARNDWKCMFIPPVMILCPIVHSGWWEPPTGFENGSQCLAISLEWQPLHGSNVGLHVCENGTACIYSTCRDGRVGFFFFVVSTLWGTLCYLMHEKCQTKIEWMFWRQWQTDGNCKIMQRSWKYNVINEEEEEEHIGTPASHR